MTAAESPTCEFDVIVPASHASLPGHFPDRPVVPGVLLLDRVLDGVEQWLEQRISLCALPQVKFVAPLFPEELAHVQITRKEQQLRFKVERADQLIAQGTFVLGTKLPGLVDLSH